LSNKKKKNIVEDDRESPTLELGLGSDDVENFIEQKQVARTTSFRSEKQANEKELRLTKSSSFLSSFEEEKEIEKEVEIIKTPTKTKKQINYAAQKKVSDRNARKRIWNADEIMKGLYLGDIHSAANLEELQKRGITHILSLIIHQAPFPDKFKYMILDTFDTSEHNMIDHFKETNDFIADGRTQGGILVHCQRGISRSSCTVIAYMMANKGYTFYDAADYVCEKRPVVCPNLGFIKQLQLYEEMKFTLNGTTSAHQTYRDLRFKSLLLDEKTKWTEKLPENYKCESFQHVDSDATQYCCSLCSANFPSKILIDKSEENKDKIVTLPYSFLLATPSQPNGSLTCPSCKQKIGTYDWNTKLPIFVLNSIK